MKAFRPTISYNLLRYCLLQKVAGTSNHLNLSNLSKCECVVALAALTVCLSVRQSIVKAAGVNLAGKRDVGMTIHVPGFLVDNLLVLNAIGYKIKTRHNGVKRSVKFDDRLQDIFLDICVAGKWKKITPDEAREAMKAVPESMDEARSLSISDLSNLIVGEPVAGLTAVVVQDEDPEN